MSGGTPCFPPSWGVETAAQIADTPAGTVHDVTLRDGSQAIAKVLKSKNAEDNLRGADFLEWRDGIGCVRLLARAGHTILMEHAGRRTLRDVLAEDSDETATRIAADVVLEYHRASEKPAPESLLPLPGYFSSLFRKAEQDRSADLESLYTEGARLAETLIGRQRDIRPLHGDLHHENIMHSPRGWIVIDPAGLIGDTALDVANMFSNPLDRFDLTRSEERTASMAGIFAQTLQRDARTILQYAFSYGCLSAAWHEEDGNVEERDNELIVAQMLKTVLRQF